MTVKIGLQQTTKKSRGRLARRPRPGLGPVSGSQTAPDIRDYFRSLRDVRTDTTRHRNPKDPKTVISYKYSVEVGLAGVTDQGSILPVEAAVSRLLCKRLFGSRLFLTFFPGAAGARGCGKVGILVLDFHFPTAHSSSCRLPFFRRYGTRRRGCGNVGISRFRRDSQGAVGRVGSLFLAFHAFHSSAISIAREPHFQTRSTRSPGPACAPAIEC